MLIIVFKHKICYCSFSYFKGGDFIIRNLGVLLVEDDPHECDEILKYVDTIDDVSLVGVTSNSTKAIEYVKDYLPDVVILDLELHKGSGNGLDFLRHLKNTNLSSPPFVLVTTNNSSSITHDLARELGADFILCKFQTDYNAQSVIEFIRSMKIQLLNRKASNGFPSELASIESLHQLNNRIYARIASEMNKVGISPKAIGNKYLVDAIYSIIKDENVNIKKMIAKKYSKSEISVERAMHNAINSAWNSSDINDLLKYYTAPVSSQKGVPTVMEFIYYYSSKIKLQI